MKSPRARYLNDPMYHQLVDMMRDCIERAEFTPSEVREAAILATIMYEETRVHRYMVPMTAELHGRLNELHEIIDESVSIDNYRRTHL